MFLAIYFSIRAISSLFWSLAASVFLPVYMYFIPLSVGLFLCIWVCSGAPCSSIQAHWHLCLTSFLSGVHDSWTWRRWCLNIKQISLVPFTSRVVSHGTLASRSLTRPKFAILKTRVMNFLCTLFITLWILNFTILWSLRSSLPTKSEAKSHMLTSTSFFGENSVQCKISPCWLLCYLDQKLL